MEREADNRAAILPSFREGHLDEMRRIVVSHVISDDSPRKEIQDCAKIELAVLVTNLRDVADPNDIGTVGIELAFDMIPIATHLAFILALRIRAEAEEFHFAHQLVNHVF